MWKKEYLTTIQAYIPPEYYLAWTGNSYLMRQVPYCPKQDFYLRQTQYFRHNNSCHDYGESEYGMNIEFVKGKEQDYQAVSS